MRPYQPLKWNLQERIKRVYLENMIYLMEQDTIKILKTFSDLLERGVHYKSEEFPIIFISIDNDFDGYSSSKQVYHYFSMLGISNEYIKFVPLKSHKLTKQVLVREQDLLIVTDASLLNINYINKGTIWWIDHHIMTLVDRLKVNNLSNVRSLNTKNTNDEMLQGLSAGMFTHHILYILLENFDIGIEKRFESETKLDALMSMISDMMIIEDYSGLYMGILEADKPNFYSESKTQWDRDNKSYFQKYTSSINNLIRMERFDLIESLIKGKGGELIKRDIERMIEDRAKLMKTYFHPLTPIHKYDEGGRILQVYQVPVEQNKIMRNHKGLLASMKTPKDRDKWITLSRVNTGNTYQYSVRTNLGGNLQRYLNKNVKSISTGGHLKSFGITIPIEKETLLFEVLRRYLNKNEFQATNTEAISITELAKMGNVKETLWKMAVRNEGRLEPDKILFKKEDFKDIKVYQKRTVYLLEVNPSEIYEVVSFDLFEKDTVIATPLCKGSVFDKYKVDILDRG